MNNITKQILNGLMEKFPADRLGESLVAIYLIATDQDLSSVRDDEETAKAVVAKLMGTTPDKLADLPSETPLEQLRIFHKMIGATIKALEKAA